MGSTFWRLMVHNFSYFDTSYNKKTLNKQNSDDKNSLVHLEELLVIQHLNINFKLNTNDLSSKVECNIF